MEYEFRIMGISPGLGTSAYVIIDKDGKYIKGDCLPVEYLVEPQLALADIVAIEFPSPPWRALSPAEISGISLNAGRLWQAILGRDVKQYRVYRKDYIHAVCGTCAGDDDLLLRTLEQRGISEETLYINRGIRTAYAVALYALEKERRLGNVK